MANTGTTTPVTLPDTLVDSSGNESEYSNLYEIPASVALSAPVLG